MNSLSNEALNSSATRGRSVAHWTAAVALASLAACGSDDGGGPSTVALADSGNVRTLASSFAIPTTVAVRDDVAWVAESQFENFEAFGGDGMPGAFRVVGIPLSGGDPQEIALPDNFFPEGITVTEAGRLYVGSVANGSILTVGPDELGAVTFVPAGALPGSVLGMAADLKRSLLWACVTDFTNSLVVGIGMADAQVKVEHPLSPGANGSGALCNDIVVSPNGTVWITESFGGRLFLIPSTDFLRPNSAGVWLEADELAGPNGPEMGAFGVNGVDLVSGRLYLVNTARSSLLSIDPTLSSPTADDLKPVVLTEAGTSGDLQLAAPDGIARRSDTELLIVENGLNLPNGKRLVSVRFDTL